VPKTARSTGVEATPVQWSGTITSLDQLC